MKNIRMIIEYDGTLFSGWQRQSRQRSVQGELEKTLSKLLKQPVEVFAASRTDAGVHAFDQQVSFKATFQIPTERLKTAANGYLPDDMRIIEVMETDQDFHARFSAAGKKYIYKLHNAAEPDIFKRNYQLNVRGHLDAEAMNKAAAYFVGTHDFKAFSANNGTVINNTVRTIHTFRVTNEGNDNILLEVKGSAFLYKMVRMMTGTLINIGLGKHPPEAVAEILTGKRKRFGQTARPNGLYLAKVYFNEEEMMRE